MRCLGIDTSNYTTSAALYDSQAGTAKQRRVLLTVALGERGLRQSEAVFQHVKRLPELLEELLEGEESAQSVGVSVRPRDAQGSYMPCFLAGELAARSIGAAGNIPVSRFSHQAGHIAAALFGIQEPGLWDNPFLAFHASGGTTECLLVRPGKERPLDVETLGRTLDLNAGQVIDRVGVMLGLGFPAGPALERLAAESENKPAHYKPMLKGGDCCLSGLENQCAGFLERGQSPAWIAHYCQGMVGETVLAMAGAAVKMHPGLPFVFAGGVMSNSFIKARIASEIKGARFAPADLSADNAVGAAVLCGMQLERKG